MPGHNADHFSAGPELQSFLLPPLFEDDVVDNDQQQLSNNWEIVESVHRHVNTGWETKPMRENTTN